MEPSSLFSLKKNYSIRSLPVYFHWRKTIRNLPVYFHWRKTIRNLPVYFHWRKTIRNLPVYFHWRKTIRNLLVYFHWRKTTAYAPFQFIFTEEKLYGTFQFIFIEEKPYGTFQFIIIEEKPREPSSIYSLKKYPGLGINSFALHSFDRLLSKNEWLPPPPKKKFVVFTMFWTVCFPFVCQRANSSRCPFLKSDKNDLLPLLFTKEWPWGIRFRCSLQKSDGSDLLLEKSESLVCSFTHKKRAIRTKNQRANF